MPTPAAEPPHDPHHHRQIAESFGVDAERYDRARPRYPDAMIARVVAASPGPDVLDVGVGTGIDARQFQAAGCRVLGVEPDGRMAAFARRTGIAVEVSTFEAWEPAGRTFDAVVAGQAWHWVDPVVGAAKAARVLRPGGRLALFWNAALPPPELAEAFAAIQARFLPAELASRIGGAGRPPRPAEAYQTMAATADGGISATGAFDKPEQWRFDRDVTYTREEWLDQVPTTGLNTRLPPATLERLLAETATAVDAAGGTVPIHYTTVVVTAARQER